jgi:hypothetical protein
MRGKATGGNAWRRRNGDETSRLPSPWEPPSPLRQSCVASNCAADEVGLRRAKHIRKASGAPQRLLCSGDGLGAPDIILVLVGLKRSFGRTAEKGKMFGAPEITLKDGLGSAVGDALISRSWFRPGQARRRHIVQGWTPPPEQFVPTPDTTMLDCILGSRTG